MLTVKALKEYLEDVEDDRILAVVVTGGENNHSAVGGPNGFGTGTVTIDDKDEKSLFIFVSCDDMVAGETNGLN